MSLKWFNRKKKTDATPEEVVRQESESEQIDEAPEANEAELLAEQTPESEAPKRRFFFGLRRKKPAEPPEEIPQHEQDLPPEEILEAPEPEEAVQLQE